MPDSLGFGSRQRPEHPRPASYPTPEQPATRRMRSPFPASNEVPAKQIASKHPTPPLSSGPLPAPPRPGPRQFAASNPSPPAIPDNSPPMRLQAAPETRTSSHKLLSRPPSVRQSSECPAVFRAPGNPPNAPPPFPAKRSPASPLRHTRPPEIPNTSRYPEIPKFLPVSLHPDSQPRHPETQKKRSRHCAGSAPNYLQVSTRSYLSRSESGSGSCSSPYC